MTIDENRARTVYQRIERETGVMPPEGSAMQEAVIRAMLALATEAAQPEGWVPSEKDAREDLKTIARRANILLTENAEVLTVTVERHVRSIRDTALRLAAASPTPPAPLRADAGEAVTTLDVFLAGYAGEPDSGLVNRWHSDDLLTWGHLRTILSALTTPKPDASEGEALATQENNHAG
ncbi:hypothetical protein [Sphingomonas sp. CCH5-D11]|uniref:hypothetical protein n=1 Tax=Sphingomonas sp. CCH5-D11 TaxID=1768786 RepID=UPI0008321556|nr:hypothetical protein [Sphingomonas sp. CCH5-D11]